MRRTPYIVLYSFLCLGFLSWIGPILGIGSGLNSIFGGGSGGGGGGGKPPFVPGGLGMADTNWQQMYGSLWDQLQQYNPQLAQQLQGGFQGGQQMQGPIQGMYGGLAGMTPQMMQQLIQQAGTAQGAQGALMGAGNQLFQNSLDPQNAFRNQLQQQVQDTSRAGSSMRGIGMGPQAVGLENQANTNFLNQWQNQQLGREAQGLQGMTGAYQQAGQQGNAVGQNLTGALGIGAMGPQFMQQGVQYPFQLANMFGGGLESNIYGPMGSAMLSGQNYLNTGVPASGQNFAAGQAGLGNLTYGLGQLANLYRGGGGGPTGDPNAPQPYATGGGFDPSGLYG